MKINKEKFHSALVWSAIGLLLFIVYGSAVLKMIDVPIDYPSHIRRAYGITWEALCHPLEFLKVNCYPVWHILTWLTMQIFECKGRSAAGVVTGGCIVIVWACAAIYLSKKYPNKKDVVRAASIALLLASPIWLPFFNPKLVLGQCSPNLLHNPTNIIARTIAFPCFIWYAAIMDGIGKKSGTGHGAWRIIFLSLLLLLSALAKPSFVQMFLPAIFILAVCKIVQYKMAAIKPVALVAVSLIPVVVLIAWQTWLALYSYGAGAGVGAGVGAVDSGIGISFLTVWSAGSPNVLVSIFLANLFPLTVLLWSMAARKITTADVLSWIMYGVAVAEAAFLIEKGCRMWHANFFWAHNLALFFIWFTAIDKFILLTSEDTEETVGLKHKVWFYIAATAMSLHLVSGLCYLWRVMVHGVWW